MNDTFEVDCQLEIASRHLLSFYWTLICRASQSHSAYQGIDPKLTEQSQWQRRRHWFIPEQHKLLHSAFRCGTEVTFHSNLAIPALAWIWEHVVSERVILPGAAMLEALYQTLKVTLGNQLHLSTLIGSCKAHWILKLARLSCKENLESREYKILTVMYPALPDDTWILFILTICSMLAIYKVRHALQTEWCFIYFICCIAFLPSRLKLKWSSSLTDKISDGKNSADLNSPR